MKYLAVITARAGSKSIPHKNTKMFCGQPLLKWSIDQSLESKYIDKIVVSTDDPVAIDIVNQYPTTEKLGYVLRPPEISGDHSPSEESMIHAAKLQNEMPEWTILLQPTSPFRFNGLIDKCIEHLEKEGADCLLATRKLYDFFWFEMHDPVIDKWSWYSSYHPKARKMRQNFNRNEFKYFDCGSIYITRTNMLIQDNNRIAGKVAVYPVSDLESFQIDSPEDFYLADKIMHGLRRDSEKKE